MRTESRTFILRQAGFVEECARAPRAAHSKVALIAGAVNTAHATLCTAAMSTVGESSSARASEHATFCASILVGGEEERRSGLVLGLCPNASVLSVACVTDGMLSDGFSIREVARRLETAVDVAVEAGCRIL